MQNREGKDGKLNIVLGFPDAAGYQSDENQYWLHYTGCVACAHCQRQLQHRRQGLQLTPNNGTYHRTAYSTQRSFDKSSES